MAYGDVKDLPRRMDKAFNIAKYPQYDGYQRGLALVVYIFFFFFFWLKGLLLRVKINLLLTQEHKLILILKTNNQQKNYISRLLENINNVKYTLLLKTTFGSADLADTQLISEYNKGIQFLFCVTDIFSKYAWVVPSKDKKDTIITNDFQKFSNQKSVTRAKYWYTKVVSFTINQ